jgi:hypothetical protein
LASALLSGGAPSALARALPAILSSDLLLASVALLLLIPALSTALRTFLFLAAVWLVPALCAGDPFLGRVAALLDAGAVFRASSAAALPTTLAAGAALALAGYLLRAGRERPSLS